MLILTDVKMERYCRIQLLSIALYAIISFSSTFAAENEECGLVNEDQFSNKQKFAQIDEFPWMAKIATKTDNSKTSFPCHAVLISQQHLLTNAHCLNIRANEPYAVLFGDWDSSNNFTENDCDEISGKCSTPVLIDIENFVRHPLAENGKKVFDIGLVRLSQKVTYSDYIRPICLPSNDNIGKEFKSEELIVSGWLRRNAGVKQKLSTFIYNPQDCHKQFKEQFRTNITDSHICAEACESGDSYLSAAALMNVVDPESKPQKVYLAGLLSFGKLKCVGGVPDVFTRVDSYLDWIKENLI